MDRRDLTGTLPVQTEGKEIIVEASVTLQDEPASAVLYAKTRSRLLRVNEWHELAGSLSADFQLTDRHGIRLSRTVEQGDYIRVDIPGPGSGAGNGYDWVKVEALTEITGGVDAIAIRVRPCSNPTGVNASIAHFYDASATSTFILERQETTVYARIIDRNTKPNDDTSSFTDELRHTIAGAAAIAAFSRLQWKALAKALLEMAS